MSLLATLVSILFVFFIVISILFIRKKNYKKLLIFAICYLVVSLLSVHYLNHNIYEIKLHIQTIKYPFLGITHMSKKELFGALLAHFTSIFLILAAIFNWNHYNKKTQVLERVIGRTGLRIASGLFGVLLIFAYYATKLQ